MSQQDPIVPDYLRTTVGTPVQPPAKPAPERQPDPLFTRGGAGTTGDTFLRVEPQRDLVTSSMVASATSVNADMVLSEGIALFGTHYGLNLISASGVVVINKGARILPSKSRPSTIFAKKIVIAGEAVIERIQADNVLALADGSEVVLGDIAYGESFVTTDKANWRVTGMVRGLASREKRVDVLAKEAIEAAAKDAPSDVASLCREQDQRIEKEYGLDASAATPRLAAVGIANGI